MTDNTAQELLQGLANGDLKTKTYHSKEIQQICKISMSQLNHWVMIGAVIPFKNIRGRGKARLFNEQNILEAIVCRELNQFSIEGWFIVKALNDIRKNGFSPVIEISGGSYSKIIINMDIWMILPKTC